jgi:hypothetical protein
LSGTFPELYITRFNPHNTLIGKFKSKKLSVFTKKPDYRSIYSLYCPAIVVGFMEKQVDTLIRRDLGFHTENISHTYGHDRFGRNFKAFRDEILKEPSIVDVTQKNYLLTQWNQGWNIHIAG